MRNSLSIRFFDTKHTDHLEQFIENRFRRLKRMHAAIIHCDVTVSTPHQPQLKGARKLVTIKAQIPGRTITSKRYTDRDNGVDLYAAISNAFLALEIQTRPRNSERVTFRNFRTLSPRDFYPLQG